MTKNEAEIVLLFDRRMKILNEIWKLEEQMKAIEQKIEKIRETDVSLLFPGNSIIWNL